jgi:hypothetical protein
MGEQHLLDPLELRLVYDCIAISRLLEETKLGAFLE